LTSSVSFSTVVDYCPKRFAESFKSLEDYYLQREFCGALAEVRDSNLFSPREALHFFLTILRTCDNTGNRYSDDYLLCAMIDASCKFAPTPEDQPQYVKAILPDDKPIQVKVAIESIQGFHRRGKGTMNIIKHSQEVTPAGFFKCIQSENGFVRFFSCSLKEGLKPAARGGFLSSFSCCCVIGCVRWVFVTVIVDE